MKTTRIGIFYDGNYFYHVSNYYQYHHERKTRISVNGLHQFIKRQVAECEGTDPRYCQIIDAHYFRGRLRADDADDMDLLYKERIFDDVLVREGVTTHYLPLSREGEKGIDVWLALEAFDLAITKHFDVVVLIACDGDFQPLLRKLNATGGSVMVLGWDFRYVDRNGNDRETRTAQVLLDEATYPIMMPGIIDDRAKRNEIDSLFVKPSLRNKEMPQPLTGTIMSGVVQTIKNGYGFIGAENGPAMFFYHGDVDGDFLDIRVNDKVEYIVGQNDRGACAKQVKKATS